MELQGYPFEIIPDETCNSIQVRLSKNGKLQVIVHPQTPQKELITYLTKNLKQIKKKIDKSVPLEDNTSIHIFDSSYAVQIDHNARTAYIRGKAVYVNTLPTTEKQTERLKQKLLVAQITQIIGFWEEQLGFLLDEITLKTIPKRYFVVHRSKSQLVFSKKLVNLSLDMLQFVVAKSVFDYLALSNKQEEILYQQHIPDWKHLVRVFDYEQG
ncbi:MAG TPA: DUF45 domain-containing protein [Sphingobacterium sp.]|nr:DUF45 domain-containing protein [Sphingobacterium sp.]